MPARTLSEMMSAGRGFLLGVELLSVRGSMAGIGAVKARTFAGDLCESPDIGWVSITDNAGGNPQMAPQALGRPILYAGREVVIHLTCKDKNRNGLESEAWLLHSEGFHNILAMTGDYPAEGNGGRAKPVFDIDSVGLISMLEKMNRGDGGGHLKTDFCVGAVTTNYKLLEGEVVPQYLKLRKKIECGARFIINQVGFDARKARELRLFMDRNGMEGVPLIGNVFLLNPKAAELFHAGRIPGIVLTEPLYELCMKQARSPDGGSAFFTEFAAKQMAVYRGLGFRGAYICGVHDVTSVLKIIETERTFTPGDWKEFAREIRFSRPGEFYYYGEETDTGSGDASRPAGSSHRTDASHRADVALRGAAPGSTPGRLSISYAISRLVHRMMFTPGGKLREWGAALSAHAADPMQGPKPLRALERMSKTLLYRCRDCGDCSLPEIAFLCPESRCAKNQRNGPCGGTRAGLCEVDGIGECIWFRAYQRLKSRGAEGDLLEHAPVIQNQALRGTSSWANNWLGRDHTAGGTGTDADRDETARPTEKA